MTYSVFCEACCHTFDLTPEAEANLPRDRVFVWRTIGRTNHRYICDNCYQNNYKFTEHGVLMYEAPNKRKRKDKYGT